MAKMFEVVDYDKSKVMLELMLEKGWIRNVQPSPTIRKTESPAALAAPYTGEPQPKDPYEGYAKAMEASGSKYLNTHLPIESVIETIAKETIGTCEDRKNWLKELKQAVKDHGHDEIITSFVTWCEAQTPFSIRWPVKLFLKNVDQNVSIVNKPIVTNPALTRIEVKVAEISDNKVFFTGNYRLQLATTIKSYGEPLVVQAFQEFYQNIDDKTLPWAPKEFLARAPVMIAAIIRKEQQVQQQKDLLAQAYQSAASDVEVLEEEEEEL